MADRGSHDDRTHTLALSNLMEAVWTPPGQIVCVPRRLGKTLAWLAAIKEPVPGVAIGADLARRRDRRIFAVEGP